MVTGAVACMAGSDPERILQLPDTTGMKGEILIYEGHRHGFDICYRVAGAELKEWGAGEGTLAEQLEAAVDENTTAVACIISPWIFCDLLLPEVVEIPHAKDVPVIMDGAAMVPPIENLTLYIEQGADLVEAARLNMSPYASVGRASKVAKEEIVGLIVALELLVSLDHEEQWATWRSWL